MPSFRIEFREEERGGLARRTYEYVDGKTEFEAAENLRQKLTKNNPRITKVEILKCERR